MQVLSDTDFKILEFINKNEPVKIEKIKSAFPNISSIDYRISLLSKMDYNQTLYCFLPNTSYITQEYAISKSSFDSNEPLGIYRVTDFGKKSLQDYKSNIKKHKKELWLKNAWIPTIAAFITTLTTMYILPKLPYLLKLLFDILKKIF